jgi:hypothetical protein
MAGGLGSLVHHRLQKDDGTSCVLGSLPLGGPARIGVLLPESNLRRRARCRLLLSCPLGQRPARRASAQHGFQLCSGRRDFVRKWQRVGDAPRVNASSRAPSARLCRPCAAGAALRPGPAGLDRTTGAVCSSMRSRRFSGPQRAIPRRHRCRIVSTTDHFSATSARFPRPVWPHVLAVGGTSAHLAASRGCGPTQAGDRARPDRGAAQLPPRMGGTTTLFAHRPNLVG